MAIRKQKIMVGDFETTVYKGQQRTDVWAAALVELGSEDVKIFHSIGETWDYLLDLKQNVTCYFHNLKFDGMFILDFMLNVKGYEQAFEWEDEQKTKGHFIERKDMQNETFNYIIDDMGQFYTLTFKHNGKYIQFRDSLKLLPFSVKSIGKAFNTRHQKLEMEYEGKRFPGCTITPEEQEYIKNDVLVVKEALETMFAEGHNKLTIGACCLSEYKKTHERLEYDCMFPDLTKIDLTRLNLKGIPEKTADEFIRKSYKGGWCYLVPEKARKVYHNGLTADVNSLYPSMMHSESGNRYPVGKPKFWTGEIPEKLTSKNPYYKNFYYFIRVRTRFDIYEGYLPTIQIKGNVRYKSTEWLETSDIYDYKTDTYHDSYIDTDGTIKPATVELTLTGTDYELLKEHYELNDFEVIGGCYFSTAIGLFDDYINKYRDIKMNSQGAKRTLAKLFLNNLYGKMASGTDSSFKYVFVNPEKDNALDFKIVKANNKKAGYIAVGSAITSYARNFTIRTAQKNYHGPDKAGFIYADTDSIHADVRPDELIDVPVHANAFCHWKLESYWDKAKFIRAKTYVEHISYEDMEELPKEEQYYSLRCAGMPDRCKDLFLKSVELTEKHETLTDLEEYEPEQIKFLQTAHEWTDFDYGLNVPGKLIPKRVPGGIILVDTSYEMKE